MQCPSCSTPLQQRAFKHGSLVDVCPKCAGLWLDGGKVLDFSDNPRQLQEQLAGGLDNAHSGRPCPRCRGRMEQGNLPGRDVKADRCAACGGLWFDSSEVQRVAASGVNIEVPEPEPEEIQSDPEARAAAQERHQGLAAGLLALPNLFLRSAFTMVLLYGLLGAVLIAVSLGSHGRFPPYLALIVGVAFAVVQFTVGPWIMDLCLMFLYKHRWVKPDELPEHLQNFVQRVCDENKMRFPSFGIIDDGAPTAFTYGHHPGNARVVISRGLLEILDPEEVEAVVAHELGHARNWDMALMTLANL